MPKQIKRRTRSGCLTCRDRHMKCDEQLPVCQNCIKSQRKCYRGVRLNFIQYSFYDPKTKGKYPPIRILDQSITIAKLYNGSKLYQSYIGLHQPEDLITSDEIFQRDNEIAGNYIIDDDKREKLIGGLSGATSAAAASRATAAIHETLVDTMTRPNSRFDNRGNVEINEDGTERRASGVSSRPAASVTIGATANATPINERDEDLDDDEIQDLDQGNQYDLLARPGTTIESPFFDEDLLTQFNIPDPFNIQNFLLKPKYQVELPPLSNSELVYENPNFDFDIHKFIKILDVEKYYWVLDLFNELNVWKTLIPNYCLNLIKTTTDEDPINGTFLINCFLNCSVDSCKDWANFEYLLKLQLGYFNLVKANTISTENFKIFEILFVSIVFNLFNLLNKIIAKFEFDKLLMIFNNQIKIFNKLIFKFFKLSNSKYKKFKSIILISSIHSIIILKHLIQKHSDEKSVDIKKESAPEIDVNDSEENPKEPQPQVHELDNNNSIDSLNWYEDLNEEINYDHVDYSSVKKMNYFEVINLESNFVNLEYVQTNPINSISDRNPESNSFKLRKLIWYSIRSDYSKRFPNFKKFNIDNSFIPKFNLFTNDMVLANDRLTLLILLSQYLLKGEVGNENLKVIFNVIENSMVTEDIKQMWRSYFRWMV